MNFINMVRVLVPSVASLFLGGEVWVSCWRPREEVPSPLLPTIAIFTQKVFGWQSGAMLTIGIRGSMNKKQNRHFVWVSPVTFWSLTQISKRFCHNMPCNSACLKCSAAVAQSTDPNRQHTSMQVMPRLPAPSYCLQSDPNTPSPEFPLNCLPAVSNPLLEHSQKVLSSLLLQRNRNSSLLP